MANITSIMNKVARNAQILGLTVVSQSYVGGQEQVVISNGSNNLTVSYILASIQSPQGGVDPTLSPYLGIGIANPGQIGLSSATGTTVPTLIDGAVAAQVLAMLCGFANDIVLLSDDGVTQLARIRGTTDWLGMGQ